MSSEQIKFLPQLLLAVFKTHLCMKRRNQAPVQARIQSFT